MDKVKEIIDLIFSWVHFAIAPIGEIITIGLFIKDNPLWKMVCLLTIALSIPWNIHRGMFGDKLKVMYDNFWGYEKSR